MDFEREIARLDAVIADNNAQDGPLATWRAADAVVEKADLIDRRDGVAAAIPLYEEAVRRLHGSVDAGPLALKAYSMNALAHAFHDIGDTGSAVRVSERLMSEHFENAPENAMDSVVDGAMLLGTLLARRGDPDRAVEVLDRLVDTYGQAARPVTLALARRNAALALGTAGRFDESIRRYEQAIELLSQAGDDERTPRLISDSMVRQAYYLFERGRPREASALCSQAIDRFAGDSDIAVADGVAWARELLAHHDDRRRRRLRLLRR